MRALLFSLMLLSLSACWPDKAPQTLSLAGKTMGTTYHITVVAPPKGTTEAELGPRIEAALADVNHKMSNWDPTSEVSLFNASTSTDAVAISPDLALVLETALEVHRLSGGKFDVTLAPLIDLWGFGPQKPGTPVPAPDDIAAALVNVGQDRLLALTGTSLQKTNPEVSVNLSAIAKGFGADKVGQTLRDAGIDNYLVEIGGDLIARGHNRAGEPWSIGIEQPDAASPTLELIVPISDKGLATSGDYRNYFEENGQRYAHIIDPTTGRPVTHDTASVTVVAPDGMQADALATAMLVLGEDAAMPIAEANGLAVFFIRRVGSDFVTESTRAFRALISDTR